MLTRVDHYVRDTSRSKLVDYAAHFDYFRASANYDTNLQGFLLLLVTELALMHMLMI